MSSVTSARTVFYLLKYTGKEHQKDFDKFPPGCRAYATWIGDAGLALQHRYNCLKSWMRGVVDADGWQALSFYKKLHAELNTWVAWNFSYDVESALGDLNRCLQPERITKIFLPSDRYCFSEKP
jgi:hypothetical protein